MGLLQNLGNIAAGVGHAVSTGVGDVVNGVEQLPQTLNNIGHGLGQIQSAYHNSPVGQAETKVLNNPIQSVTPFMHPVQSAAHALQQNVSPVFNPYMQSAINDYGYTPQFKQLASQVPVNPTPSKMPGQAVGAEAEYVPTNNQIYFNQPATVKDSSPDYTLTHELLHAQYQRMNPSDQQNFLKMANQSITPQQRAFLTAQLNSPTYNHYKMPQDLTQVPSNIATEIHSYLPAAVDWGQKTGHMPPAQAAYYSKYMNSNAITDPTQYLPDEAKGMMIAAHTGMLNDSMGQIPAGAVSFIQNLLHPYYDLQSQREQR